MASFQDHCRAVFMALFPDHCRAVFSLHVESLGMRLVPSTPPHTKIVQGKGRVGDVVIPPPFLSPCSQTWEPPVPYRELQRSSWFIRNVPGIKRVCFILSFLHKGVTKSCYGDNNSSLIVRNSRALWLIVFKPLCLNFIWGVIKNLLIFHWPRTYPGHAWEERQTFPSPMLTGYEANTTHMLVS